MPEALQNLLDQINASGWYDVVAIVGLLVAAVVVHRVARHVLQTYVASWVKRTSTAWDDRFMDRGLFSRIAWYLPLVGVQIVAASLIRDSGWADAMVRVAQAATAIVAAGMIGVALLVLADRWDESEASEGKPIKGYAQLISLVTHLLAIVYAIAILMDRSPWALLTGIGAATAVLLLIFKDTILSLVASVQLSSYDMVKIGDWVSLPAYNADGSVIDMSLHTVKVQNWDKTISTIPTHKLVDGTIKNWRGMQESGGRRVKRAMRVDMSTIRFLTDEDIERLSRIALLKPYLDEKRDVLAEANAGAPAPEANARRLTNIGTFRAYAARYIRENYPIRDDMTFLVRQLPADPQGLPIEVYFFTATTVWTEYEGIQADVFDHLFAILPEFGLTPYQAPSSADIRATLGRE